MACLARSSTTAWPVPGESAPPWPPRSRAWSIAAITSARADESSGVSRERYSHSSSMRSDSGDVSSAALAAAPADDSSMATELRPAPAARAGGPRPIRPAARNTSPGHPHSAHRRPRPPVRSGGVPRSRRARRKGAAIFTVSVCDAARRRRLLRVLRLPARHTVPDRSRLPQAAAPTPSHSTRSRPASPPPSPLSPPASSSRRAPSRSPTRRPCRSRTCTT